MRAARSIVLWPEGTVLRDDSIELQIADAGWRPGSDGMLEQDGPLAPYVRK